MCFHVQKAIFYSYWAVIKDICSKTQQERTRTCLNKRLCLVLLMHCIDQRHAVFARRTSLFPLWPNHEYSFCEKSASKQVEHGKLSSAWKSNYLLPLKKSSISSAANLHLKCVVLASLFIGGVVPVDKIDELRFSNFIQIFLHLI